MDPKKNIELPSSNQNMADNGVKQQANLDGLQTAGLREIAEENLGKVYVGINNPQALEEAGLISKKEPSLISQALNALKGEASDAFDSLLSWGKNFNQKNANVDVALSLEEAMDRLIVNENRGPKRPSSAASQNSYAIEAGGNKKDDPHSLFSKNNDSGGFYSLPTDDDKILVNSGDQIVNEIADRNLEAAVMRTSANSQAANDIVTNSIKAATGGGAVESIVGPHASAREEVNDSSSVVDLALQKGGLLDPKYT